MKSPKREAEFHRIQAEFLGQMYVISMYMIWIHPSENPLPNKVDCPSCISECYSKELWKFDEAVGMGTRQCQ